MLNLFLHHNDLGLPPRVVSIGLDVFEFNTHCTTVWNTGETGDINSMWCPIKVSTNTIELTVHTSCYCILEKLCAWNPRLLVHNSLHKTFLRMDGQMGVIKIQVKGLFNSFLKQSTEPR